MITEKYKERFWEKVVIKGEDDCWPWTASTDGRGYGQMKSPFNVPRNLKAPRISLMISDGITTPVPRELYTCHTCDNPICVNPKHLFWGTNKDNQRDSVRKGRRDNIPGLSGEKNGHSKITDVEREEINLFINEGELNNKEIAAMYPIGHSWVSKIRVKLRKQLALTHQGGRGLTVNQDVLGSIPRVPAKI